MNIDSQFFLLIFLKKYYIIFIENKEKGDKIMDNYYVAPSYQNLEKIGNPFQVNNKLYQMVKMTNGKTKQVRLYDEKEYTKYYPKVEVIQPAKSRRDVLGFGEAGYIWLFKNATYELKDWFKASPCRYTRVWNWYLPSNIELPEPLPAGIEPIKLMWDEVSNDNQLLPEADVQKIVESKIYEAGPSEWIGKIGERLTLTLVCRRVVETESNYGISNIHTLLDENNNIFIWATSSRRLEENHIYELTGTVKKQDIYRNNKQTTLSNCRIKEDLGVIDD